MSDFNDVDKVLTYVYRVDGLSAYPASPLSTLAGDGCVRSRSGLSRLDHITQGAMIMSLVHSSLDSVKQAALEVNYIDGDDMDRYNRRLHAAAVLVERFREVARFNRSDAYLVSETLRWGGDSRRRFTRRDGEPAYVGQRRWAVKEGVHPRTLRNHNRELHKFLNDMLQSARDGLDIPFTDALLVGVFAEL